jgi:hypothetical protein
MNERTVGEGDLTKSGFQTNLEKVVEGMQEAELQSLLLVVDLLLTTLFHQIILIRSDRTSFIKSKAKRAENIYIYIYI